MAKVPSKCVGCKFAKIYRDKVVEYFYCADGRFCRTEIVCVYYLPRDVEFLRRG